MFDNLKLKIVDELSEHIMLYLILFFVFCAGIIAGMYSLDSLNTTQKQNALVYVNSSFAAIKQSTLNWSSIFKNSLYNNAILYLPLIFFGLFTITVPLAFVVICAKGYLIGFSALFIIKSYSFFGLFIVLLCVILPSVLTLPCYFVMAKKAIINGVNKLKRRDIPQTNKDVLLSMGGYISESIIMCLFLSVALLIESVLMPIIMSGILRLY